MKPLYARDRAAWRTWLRRNAKTATDVWLLYYKKHSAKPSVSFDEALDEALCFGWVDTKVKGLDADRYMMRFAPRRPGSSWSPSNIERAKRLIAQRRMTGAGTAAFEGHERRRTPAHPTRLRPALARRFAARRSAWRSFSACPPGYQRTAIGWVASAKRAQTQERRLDRLIEASERGERLAFI